MSSTISPLLALSLPDNTDTAWGDDYRSAMTTLERILVQDDVWHVSPEFTTANVYPNGAPSGRRYFDKIQDAVLSAAAVTSNVGQRIYVHYGEYHETIRCYAPDSSIAIIGVPGAVGMGPGALAGRLPLISGDTSGSATIAVYPKSGTPSGFMLANVILAHDYDDILIDAGASQGWIPYLFYDTNQPGQFPGSPNRCHLYNVQYAQHQMQQVYDFSFVFKGYLNVSMVECQFRFPYQDDKRLNRPIYCVGDVSASVSVLLQTKRCDFYQDYVAASTWPTIHLANNANHQSIQSTYQRTAAQSVYVSVTGQNGSVLEDQAEAERQGNIFGVNAMIGY